MKVIHVSVLSSGGAGTAARRSVEALRGEAIDAQLWSADVGPSYWLRSQKWSQWRSRLSNLPSRFYRRRHFFSVWSNSWVPSRIGPKLAAAQPDLIHFHWIGDGFVHLNELLHLRIPMVWTLHDAWAFTGGCHYPGECTRFRQCCGHCPQLGSNHQIDLSAWNFRQKRMIARGVSRWISPSKWLADLAQNGPVIPKDKLRVIHNGFDGSVFHPRGRQSARMSLGLSAETIVIAAGAANLNESRKGVGFLPETLQRVREATGQRCLALIFGQIEGSVVTNFSHADRYIGNVSSEATLAKVLAAADILLMPSLQDNLPNIAVEAQACGCPVIGFNTGGLREIIEPNVTGALADEITAEALANAAVGWIKMVKNRERLAESCRVRFDSKFTYPIHARRILDEYHAILAEASTAKVARLTTSENRG